MPFNLSFQPAQSLVAQAGFQSGLGDYNRFLSNLQVQQQQLNLQNTMNLRGLAEQTYQTQFGAANQQFMQQQDINSQLVQQARSIDSQQYQQQQGLLNQRVMQQNQLSFAAMSQLSQQAFQANEQANQIQNQQYMQQYGAAAGMASQQFAAQANQALSGQQFMQSLGLGDQNFASNAALANLQTQNAMDLNQANLQTQADFMPTLSQAQYSAQQQVFAQKTQALQDALSQGQIDQPTFDNAQQQLLAQQVGLRAMMPSQTDVANQFAASAYTDPGTGMRYLFSPQSGFQLDPGVQPQLQYGAKSQMAVNSSMQALMNQELGAQEAVGKLAAEYQKIGMPADVATALARTTILPGVQQTIAALKRSPQLSSLFSLAQ